MKTLLVLALLLTSCSLIVSPDPDLICDEGGGGEGSCDGGGGQGGAP